MKIKDPEFAFFPLGFYYAHNRGDWLFHFSCRLYNFKFGADWNINHWQLDDLYLYFGFFEFNWTRIYAKQRSKTDEKI